MSITLKKEKKQKINSKTTKIKDMLETNQLFQVPQLMPATHPHHPDYMFQKVVHLVIAYQIGMPQITLISNKVNQHDKKRKVFNLQKMNHNAII